jgi:hypothetical protein
MNSPMARPSLNPTLKRHWSSRASWLSAFRRYLVDLKRQYAGHENHLAMVSDVLASLINQQRGEFLPGSERQDASTT